MIDYIVNEEKKIVVCRINGPEVKHIIDKIIMNELHDISGIDFAAFVEPTLKREYVGVAKYHVNEDVTFNVKLGKDIARKKAFEKMNKDIVKILTRIKKQVIMWAALLSEDIQKYQVICDDIKQNISNY